MKNVDQQVVWIFFGCWAVLGIGSFVFFQLNKNAWLKRRVLRWGHLFADLLFLGFMAWIGFPIQAFYLMIPALIVITVLNLWGTKFCPRCGKTLIHAYRAQYCTRCGHCLSQIEPETARDGAVRRDTFGGG